MTRRYFPVARFGKWLFPTPATSMRIPVSLVHAKEMGTSTTLCGLDCSSWERFWEHPFPATQTESCPRCVVRTRAAVGAAGYGDRKSHRIGAVAGAPPVMQITALRRAGARSYDVIGGPVTAAKLAARIRSFSCSIARRT